MNKRERQQQKKIQKQAAAERNSHLLRYAMFGLGGLLAVLLLFTLYERMTLAVPTTIEVTANDQIKGYPSAPMTLVEYSDFQCPSCNAQHRSFRQVWKQIRRDVKLVYRHYPIVRVHKNATEAAYYAEAAGKQGKFWEMHDALFDDQSTWSEQGDPTATFDSMAETLELDMDQLRTDVASDAVKDKVKADIASAKSAGVSGTPTLFLDGKLLSNVRDPANLVAAIRKAKAAKAAAEKAPENSN